MSRSNRRKCLGEEDQHCGLSAILTQPYLFIKMAVECKIWRQIANFDLHNSPIHERIFLIDINITLFLIMQAGMCSSLIQHLYIIPVKEKTPEINLRRFLIPFKKGRSLNAINHCQFTIMDPLSPSQGPQCGIICSKCALG